jgi:hypothetical protein
LRSRVRIDTPFVGVMASVGTLFLAVMALVLTSPPLPESELIDPPRAISQITLLPSPPPVRLVQTERRTHGRTEARLDEDGPPQANSSSNQLDPSSGLIPPWRSSSNASASGLEQRSTARPSSERRRRKVRRPRWSGGPGGPAGTIDSIGDIGTHGPGTAAIGGDFGPKKDGGSIRPQGDPIVIGALGKAEIDAVIKRHLSSIRYCYERQLFPRADLAGKVSIKFVISKSGAVSRAVIDSSTVNDEALESCLQSQFLRMQFPEPKGGGIVIVNYPFLFAPG